MEGAHKPSGTVVSKAKSRSKALEGVARTNHKITQWTQPVISKASEMKSDQIEGVSYRTVLSIEWIGSRILAIEWKNGEPRSPIDMSKIVSGGGTQKLHPPR